MYIYKSLIIFSYYKKFFTPDGIWCLKIIGALFMMYYDCNLEKIMFYITS